MKKEKVQDGIRNYAFITAYRRWFENASSMTFDDRPQELKDLDKKKGITEPHLLTPYGYSDVDHERRGRELLASLLCHHYGVAFCSCGKIIAKEEFNFCRDTDFFIAVNWYDEPSFLETILNLAEYYNQTNVYYNKGWDSILEMLHKKFTPSERFKDAVDNKSGSESSLSYDIRVYMMSQAEDKLSEPTKMYFLEDFDEATVMEMKAADAIVRKNILEMKTPD